MAEKMTAKEVEAAVAALPGWTAEADAAIAKTFKLADHIAAMGFVVQDRDGGRGDGSPPGTTEWSTTRSTCG